MIRVQQNQPKSTLTEQYSEPRTKSITFGTIYDSMSSYYTRRLAQALAPFTSFPVVSLGVLDRVDGVDHYLALTGLHLSRKRIEPDLPVLPNQVIRFRVMLYPGLHTDQKQEPSDKQKHRNGGWSRPAKVFTLNPGGGGDS